MKQLDTSPLEYKAMTELFQLLVLGEHTAFRRSLRDEYGISADVAGPAAEFLSSEMRDPDPALSQMTLDRVLIRGVLALLRQQPVDQAIQLAVDEVAADTVMSLNSLAIRAHSARART